MRKVIGRRRQDTTLATQADLASADAPIIRDLYIIGRPEDPRALYLTNHEAPVLYRPYGLFLPAVVKRDGVEAKVGLEAQQLGITWTPGASALASQTQNTTTASPYQLAAQHVYDNWPVLILRCFMPTPGDADTLGCAVWFGGRIHTSKVKRNALVFSTKSYLDVLQQKIPSTVVEVTNTLASTAVANVPVGDPTIPLFTTVRPSSTTLIAADCYSPSAGRSTLAICSRADTWSSCPAPERLWLGRGLPSAKTASSRTETAIITVCSASTARCHGLRLRALTTSTFQRSPR